MERAHRAGREHTCGRAVGRLHDDRENNNTTITQHLKQGEGKDKSHDDQPKIARTITRQSHDDHKTPAGANNARVG